MFGSYRVVFLLVLGFYLGQLTLLLLDELSDLLYKTFILEFLYVGVLYLFASLIESVENGALKVSSLLLFLQIP